ncbi:hypothetical protein, partial [Stigmatella hybrida]|uniref:hypothetical protein n=1 Tax=Stigmatella hybrida TaxID=394097 RepID=UPI001CDA9E9D
MKWEAAGIELTNKAMENLKQDALLPAIALILLGFVIPSRPTPCPRVPSLSPLEGVESTGGAVPFGFVGAYCEGPLSLAL